MSKILCRLFACAVIALSFPLMSPDSASAATTLDSVIVIPNPYNVSGRVWGTESNALAFERIRFQNVPVPATISIYTSAGNHVVTLDHDGSNVQNPFLGKSESNAYSWTGRNKDNQYVNSDLYIYVVESPTLGKKIGKFIVIR